MVVIRGWQERVVAPSIPGRFVLDMLAGYRHRGGDLEALLAPRNLTPGRLQIEGFRVSVSTYVALLEAVATALQDEALGFLETPLPLRAYATFCSGLSGKQSLQEVMVFYERFYGLFTRQFRYELRDEGGDTCTLVVSCDEQPGLEYRFFYQSLLLSLVRLLGWLLGIKLVPVAVRFGFAARDYEAHLAYLFDCPIAYEAGDYAVVLPRALLHAPMAVSLDLVDRMLKESRFTLLITERSKPFTQQVKQHLLMTRGDQWPDVGVVAVEMRLSPNRLWRKLKREGSTFSGIRDELKRDWALHLAMDPALSAESIAETLRFAEVRGFHKAFRKWTGTRLSDYRRRLSQA